MTVAASPLPAAPELPPELCALPRGKHGLPREFVERNQRARIVAGMIEAAARHGYAGAAVSRVIAAAGVSRRTFYDHFAGKEECFEAAYETCMGEIRRRFESGFGLEEEVEGVIGRRPEAVERALAALLSFLADNPRVARVATVEVLSSTPRLAERHHAEVAALAPCIAPRGPGAEGNGGGATSLTEEVILAGIFALISQRVLAGKAETLPGLLPELVGLAGTPSRTAALASG